MSSYWYRYVSLVGENQETEKSYLDLDGIQDEIIAWQDRNFGRETTYNQTLMGMMEELGELAHSFLKQEQGIRGTWDEHEEVAKDSVGDLCVYMMALCAKRGWRLSDIIEETWLKVQKRDWTRNKLNGETGK